MTSGKVIRIIYTIGLINSITFASVQEAVKLDKISASAQSISDVRVVSDLKVINGRNGVPIEYWYNETQQSASDLVSAPGCPQSIDGIPWIYFGQPPRCFLAGTYGSCPPDQKLLIQKGSPNGVCACECLTEYDFSKNLQGPDRYVRCYRNQQTVPPPNEQIFDKKEKKCYFMYEKGPCQKKGTVLTDMTSDSLECFRLCDMTQADWEKTEEAGLCKRPTYVLSSSISNGGSQCEDDEVFSKILKMCIRKSLGQSLQVGSNTTTLE